MENTVWITKRKQYEFEGPTAVLGSSGLRSIGKLVVDDLIKQTKAELIADLYSTHLPSVYQTKPSYAADPASPGEANCKKSSTGKIASSEKQAGHKKTTFDQMNSLD